MTYELDEDEPVTRGLLEAFDAIGYDLTDQTPPLSEFVAPHAINTLRWENPNHCVITSIWRHPVKITSDRITVYRVGDTHSEDRTRLIVTGNPSR